MTPGSGKAKAHSEAVNSYVKQLPLEEVSEPVSAGRMGVMDLIN